MLFLLLFNLLYGIDGGTSIASKLFLVVTVANTTQLMDYWILYSSARIPRNDQYSEKWPIFWWNKKYFSEMVMPEIIFIRKKVTCHEWNFHMKLKRKCYQKSLRIIQISWKKFFFVDNNFRCLFGFIACFQYFYIFLYSVNAYYFCSFSPNKMAHHMVFALFVNKWFDEKWTWYTQCSVKGSSRNHTHFQSK